MSGETDAPAAERDDTLESAWRLLMGLVLEQRWRWSDVAAELGLSQAGLRALLGVDPDLPRPMRDLARAMNCDPSYVTAMVDDLERAGYAERRSLPTDRRVKTVMLTASGKRALRRVQRDLFPVPAQLSRLTMAERHQLGRLLATALVDRST
jgi:DNA-binding MarR family transcriptional regulator